MKVFKFGGASVKDANGVENVSNIIAKYNTEPLLVVVSAMGKTTNLLETLVKAVYNKSKSEIEDILKQLRNYHWQIMEELNATHNIQDFNDVENLFLELECFVETPFSEIEYDYLYDQIVIFGELISTRIVSNYMLSKQFKNYWLDARNFIITNSNYRDAKINWESTKLLIENRLKPIVQKNVIITQGFMGRGVLGESTTLGREGSDYSAATFAYGLQANSVTIWKDVAGVMNADPKKIENALLLDEINYKDAIELAYYGASVIHPKTIQPLQAGNIPLFVKSFIQTENSGTIVSNAASTLKVPCFIAKSNQVLIQISSMDFSFIVEGHLKDIFEIMAEYKIKSNIIQNSAIQFSIVADDKDNLMEQFVAKIQELKLKIEIQKNLELLTIYNYSSGAESTYARGRIKILEQFQSGTAQFLFNQ